MLNRFSWIRNLFEIRVRQVRKEPPKAIFRRLIVEALEDRIAPTGSHLAVTGSSAPSVAVLGQQIPVSWTVQNQGTDITSGSWTDAVYMSDNPFLDSNATLLQTFAETNRAPLAAGASYTDSEMVTIPAFAGVTGGGQVGGPGGGQRGSQGSSDHYVVFVTDVYSNVPGDAGQSSTVGAAPTTFISDVDLTVSSITGPSGNTAQVGSTVSVSYTVQNLGSAAATSFWYDEIVLADAPQLQNASQQYVLQYVPVFSGLTGGGRYTNTEQVSLPSSLAAGSYYLIVQTNAYRQQSETDTTNDSAATAISLTTPDLKVTSADGANPGGAGGYLVSELDHSK